ncbi:nucleotide-diphospho-sugar transferase [Phaeosphaeria sp. MPI-PUGE-AT-0046c]|nr:nucleotide-diphospho-sugar transferase [Phaeosphaeria sp. MPI-PUGE-AT-0046c]
MLAKSRLWIVYAVIALGFIYEVHDVATDLHKEPLAGSFNPHPATPVSALPPNPSPTLAIATFLTGQVSDDSYFNLTRLFVYQLLHAEDTRITNPDLTVVVLCGRLVSEDKKEQIKRLGATVITLEDVQLPEWIHIGEPRWAEQFTKLRAFEQTQFKRMLYVDADYIIMHPLDKIFDESIVQELTPTLNREDQIKEDEGILPGKWLFAARSENGGQGGFSHFVPPITTNYANGGFFLIAPDQAMYNHLTDVMKIEGRFPTTFMEQDLLNYVFRRDGPMPWRELDWKWSANFVNEEDVKFGIHSLHGKFWREGPQVVRDRYARMMHELDELEARLAPE